MDRIWGRQAADSTVTVHESSSETVLSGSTVVPAEPTGTVFQVNSTAATDSFVASVTSAAASVSPSVSTNQTIQQEHPIPLRTLIAVCVAAFVLVAGLVIFVLWFGSRAKKGAAGKAEVPAPSTYSRTTGEDVGLKGLSSTTATTSALPPLKSVRSAQSSYYSQDSRAIPGRSADAGYTYSRWGTSGEYREQPPYSQMSRPSTAPRTNGKRESFLNMRGGDTDGESPMTPSQFINNNPPPNSPPGSPRPPSAQPITRPYVIGSHPYASPFYATHSQAGASTDGGYHHSAIPEQDHEEYQGHYGNSNFADAGARPGYDAYGFEPRHIPPIGGNVSNRPSIDSIRNIAKSGRNADLANEFGGPGFSTSRSRKNSSSSSIIRFAPGSSQIASPGSARGNKEKISKEEKAREMAAMDNLIAALDQNAEIERQRKEGLVSAAGIDRSAPATPRRRDVDITGSYPLPPPEVFRKALTSHTSEDELDDAEIERWRRR